MPGLLVSNGGLLEFQGLFSCTEPRNSTDFWQATRDYFAGGKIRSDRMVIAGMLRQTFSYKS